MSALTSKDLRDRFWVLVGTRPEVIKQVPVLWALRKEFGDESVALVGTGQHRELLEQSLRHFGVELDLNLDVMKPNQGLSQLSATITSRFGELVAMARPRAVIVQGDTLSAAMAAWVCFLEKIPHIHNEAGLRSYDLAQPFPEEGCRKLISITADLHFAPTELAAEALRREGVDKTRIAMVGNPVVDSLFWTLNRPCPSARVRELLKARDAGRKLVLVTSHRRENAGAMAAWYAELGNFVESHPDIELICPIHPNNLAREAASRYLEKLAQVHLLEPLDYLETCHLLRACHMVVTDSGGIQEEGATLGVPVVVCRKATERMEGVHAGLSRLADPEKPNVVVEAMNWAYQQGPFSQFVSPYGSGHSGEMMARVIRERFVN